MASQRIAVLFVHGIEIDDPRLVDKPMNLLRDSFTDASGVPADQALTIRPLLWGHEEHQRQDEVFRRCLDPGGASFSQEMTRLVTGVNAGSQRDLLQLLWRSPLPTPELGGLRFPALRWFFVHFGGDVIAYQITNGDRTLYDDIHVQLADVLRELVDENHVGPDAPLCVISHSLGTIITSNYFYDLQNGGPTGPLVSPPVRARIRESNPLETGQTLTFLYTLGSPLALWASSYIDTAGRMGRPLFVPAPQLPTHHPQLANVGGWVNVLDPDDIIAYPLQPLGGDYRTRVMDQLIDVGPLPAGATPLSHISYWYDRRVIEPIAKKLAEIWKLM